jgi:hypothetical protein
MGGQRLAAAMQAAHRTGGGLEQVNRLDNPLETFDLLEENGYTPYVLPDHGLVGARHTTTYESDGRSGGIALSARGSAKPPLPVPIRREEH